VAAGGASALAAGGGRIGPKLGIVNSGRHLTPYGDTARVGNFPTGGAVTPGGRFYWAVAAGAGFNDVRIVSVSTRKVIQVIPLPGASGGVAIDPRGGRAYVSGLANTPNKGVSRPKLPGGGGDVIHVFKYSKTTGKAKETGQIGVPPQPGAPKVEDFPIQRSPIAYPMHLAVAGDGKTLLVPLGLSAAAAIVNVPTHAVKYVLTGPYPYGAAILPGGTRGLVTNEEPGTVSVINLKTATKIRDINVGGHLSHPEAILVRGGRAYITVTNRDRVAVIDLGTLKVERFLSVKIPVGIGTAPDGLAVTASGRQLLVADSGADWLDVFSVPKAIGGRFTHAGRIPTAHYPTDVGTVGGKHPKIVWLSAKGLGIGPNPFGPDPFHSVTLDQSAAPRQFMPRITYGSVGIGKVPSRAALRKLTHRAERQLVPSNQVLHPPSDTPLRANGPIKHVFYIVRENRTYDQILGDDSRGDGKQSLTLFGQSNTPNMHALVKRFPLVDHLYANSEASQQGHQWTSAGSISDYSEKNWNQITNVFGNYGTRGRPLQTGVYVVSFPPRGYLFDQALRQKISFFNYGEVYAGDVPLPFPGVTLVASTVDHERTAADATEIQRKYNHSDLQPGVGNQCYPNAFYTGPDIVTGKYAFDSTVPNGAPSGSESRVACFRKHFAQQVAAGKVPTFNYITLMNDHTRGLTAGAYTPQAMIADNDRALGQIVDTITHNAAVWAHSAIFVVEDDSQDGADHVDAHRIPAAVISPYARGGAIVHTRYDQLSVVRSMELIMGMHPLSLNDALATPMYDAFQAVPTNIGPFSLRPETVSLLATNAHGTHGARESAKLDFTHLDAVPQHTLDNLLWESVHGPSSKPPAPGPNAVRGHDAEG
jgi:YVTN family beta-propeller protein